MKMVIVFDTDDRQGMTNTVKIVDQLAAEYLNKNVDERYKRSFGKIEFIKTIREFGRQVAKELAADPESDPTGLLKTKCFTEKVWEVKQDGRRYP
jgi:hypothetical protein